MIAVKRWHVTARIEVVGARPTLAGFTVAVSVTADDPDVDMAEAADIADGFTDTAIRAAIVRAINDDDRTVVSVTRDGVAI